MRLVLFFCRGTSAEHLLAAPRHALSTRSAEALIGWCWHKQLVSTNSIDVHALKYAVHASGVYKG